MKLESFDLKIYAARSLNYLTTLTDEKMGYLPYWLVKLAEKPSYARHCRVDDAEIAPSWSKAIMLIRRMLGTEKGGAHQEGFRKLMMENFRDDGLSYNHSFPWEKVEYSNMHEAAWVLDAMVYYLMDTGSARVEEKIVRMIQALDRISIHKKGRFFWHGYYDQPYKSAYIPFDNYFMDRGLDGTIWTGRSEETTRNGDIVLGLVEFAELTGSKAAMELAGAMVNHIVFDSRKFGFEGHYIGHVHATMWTVTGVLKYAILNERDDLVEWSKQVYEYTKRFSTSYGWVPEYVNRKDASLELCETCCIADMIRCALLFAEAGMPEYWEDVDRFTRNHLVQSQLSHSPKMVVDSSLPDTDDTTYRDIDKRIIGAFSAGTSPNFFPPYSTRATGGCCGATGANTLYYVWKEIAKKKADGIHVNLMMECDTDYITVKSEVPSEGKVTLLLKENSPVFVRIPEFAESKVNTRINGEDVGFIWNGSYIKLQVRKGDTLEVLFDVPLRKTMERQAYTDYQVNWKGNTVLNVMPDATFPESGDKPLYARFSLYNYEPSRL